MAWIDKSVIVDIDLVHSVILVDAVKLSEDNFAKFVEFRGIASLCISDQVVDLFIHTDIVFAQLAYKLIFADLAEHVACYSCIHLGLIKIHGWVVNTGTMPLVSASVINHI